MHIRTFALVCVCGLATASAGAQELVGRDSGVSYSYVYGAGGDTNVDNLTTTDLSLLASDNEVTGFIGSTSGFLPGNQPYSGGVDGRAEHEYAITGPLSGFSSITASGQTDVSSFATGLGSALMHSSNPGNQLILYFDLAAPTDYSLTGSIELPGASAFSLVALQFFDGIVWQNGIFNSIFLPGGMGSFDKSGTLAPGKYRMYSQISLNATGNQTFTGSYDYRLTVPAPASGLMLAMGGLVMGRRRPV